MLVSFVIGCHALGLVSISVLRPSASAIEPLRPCRSATLQQAAQPGTLTLGENAGSAAAVGRPTITIPRAATPPVVDGQLDDVIWRSATHVTELTQQRPLEGAPASEDTDIWMAYDSRNMYLAFHAHYADPTVVRANRSDRDKISRDDTISVYFDPFLDQQRAYIFSVNAYGVQGDSLLSSNARGTGGCRLVWLYRRSERAKPLIVPVAVVPGLRVTVCEWT